MAGATRRPQRLAVEFLETMLQHRAIRFLKNVKSDLDSIVRPDAQDVAVERRVMKFAKRQTIWHDCETLRMPIRENVRRLEQFLVT